MTPDAELLVETWRSVLGGLCSDGQTRLHKVIATYNDELHAEYCVLLHEEPTYWLVNFVVDAYGRSGPVPSSHVWAVMQAMSLGRTDAWYFDPTHDWERARTEVARAVREIS